MSSMTGQTGPTGQTGNKIPKGYKLGQIQNFTPEMMELFNQLFSHVGPESYLSRLAEGDEDLFNEIEAPAKRDFTGLQGNLASRFSGQGMGARRSSGFQNTMNAASSDFAQDLQSKRQGLQRDALKDLMGFSNDLLNQKPYESLITEKPKKWWQELAMEFGKSAAKAGGQKLFGGGGGGGGGGNQEVLAQAASIHG